MNQKLEQRSSPAWKSRYDFSPQPLVVVCRIATSRPARHESKTRLLTWRTANAKPRRLEPKDRIRELGDASVPFEFDIHAMIWSEDAPALECALHRHFLRMQMNKVNPRKEFFRLALADIRREVEGLGISAHWTMAAEAREYRETLKIEAQLRADPTAQAEWERHQMEIDPAPAEDAEEVL